MKIGKELDELHARTEEMYRKAILSIRERFDVSKKLNKQIEAITYNLDTYELMSKELEKIARFSESAMNTKELSTIEGELKSLLDNFWN